MGVGNSPHARTTRGPAPKDGFNTAKAAKRAGEKALHTLLESLSGEKLNA
jgi:hypothetical protein